MEENEKQRIEQIVREKMAHIGMGELWQEALKKALIEAIGDPFAAGVYYARSMAGRTMSDKKREALSKSKGGGRPRLYPDGSTWYLRQKAKKQAEQVKQQEGTDMTK